VTAAAADWPGFIATGTSGTPIRRFLVYGERNSGTNFVDALLRQNFPALEAERGDSGRNWFLYGWKHGFPTMIAAPPDMLAVVMVRDPVAWVGSLHAKPWHAGRRLRGLPIADFIRAEWVSVIDDRGFGVRKGDPRWGQELLWDRDPATGLRFQNVLRLRNAKTAGFLRMCGMFGNHAVVRYEDAARDAAGLVQAVASRFGMVQAAEFSPVVAERGNARSGSYRPKAYADLSPEDLAFLWSELDRDQEARLGYRPG
jgi:hypothetical protein